MKKEIWYFGHRLEFRREVEDSDEAQILLDWERQRGRTACATHYNSKHQIYSSPNRNRV